MKGILSLMNRAMTDHQQGRSKFTPQAVRLTTVQFEYFKHFLLSPQLAKCDLPDVTAKALVRKNLIAEQSDEWHLTQYGIAYLNYLYSKKPHIYRKKGRWKVREPKSSIFLKYQQTYFTRRVSLFGIRDAVQFAERLNEK